MNLIVLNRFLIIRTSLLIFLQRGSDSLGTKKLSSFRRKRLLSFMRNNIENNDIALKVSYIEDVSEEKKNDRRKIRKELRELREIIKLTH